MASHPIDRQVIYEGKKVKLEVRTLEDDETGVRHRAEVIVHPGAVVILPMLDESTVVMIRNRRHTIGQTLLELPAGTLEKGEDPMNAAGRELQEETGYLATRMKSLGAFYSSPGIMTEKMYSFVAYDLKKTRTALEAGEEIEVQPTPIDDAIDMIREGHIVDGKTIATLLIYDRFHRNKA